MSYKICQPEKVNNKIVLLNGPNLNLLGKREPEIYGHTTLSDIENKLAKQAEEAKFVIDCFQSNSEAEIVSIIQQVGLLNSQSEQTAAFIINPGAYTHTSIAIRDALLATNKPYIEVHLSNIHSRESFRHHSFLSDKALGVICGLGAMGYEMALKYLISNQSSIT